MKQCECCNADIKDGEDMKYQAKILCEDCFIDLSFSKARKASYNECAHSFMLRLRPGFDNRRLF